MTSRTRPHPFSLSLLSLTLVACGGGGGGSGTVVVDPTPASPQLPAEVPEGTGIVSIDMAGVWLVQGASVVESNDPAQMPLPEGTPVVLEADRVVSIAGLSVSPIDLSLLLGPLRYYVNQADGSTVYYAVSIDNRATGGTLEVAALAGGSVDADTISVEGFVSSQGVTATEARFTRSRYQLKRVAASPAMLESDPDLCATVAIWDEGDLEALRQRMREALGLPR